MNFLTRYKKLNANQAKAVDTIDGPVMVIAGPGTGKTELLSMRVANILQKTDTLAENILCLTFTESGASAMRERLAQIIGKDAYKVAIHTFHSFGTEVINQHGDYFYQGAHFQPADELATHQIVTSILDELDYTSPIVSKMNGDYTYLRDIIGSISDLKKSGLTSDELLEILDSNDQVLDLAEPELAELFSQRINKNTRSGLEPIAHNVAAMSRPQLPNGIASLSSTLALSMAHAIDEATETDSTKPITAWKNKWLTKNNDGAVIFKDRARHEKLRAVAYVYFQYLSRMQEAELFDYDDMILRVVHALEVFDELRFNLQEKYQYIMVDEFQDTNLAQMRVLASLTNNPAHGDTPNILVVGDDDQAIYSFQGADVSNILSFRELYPGAVLIPLVDNYRSGAAILESSRAIISQGSERLENHIAQLDKTLIPHVKSTSTVSLYEAASTAEERSWLAHTIAKEIEQGREAQNIAVLTRRHSELVALLPYFADAGVEVSYERRDNVFDIPPVALLLETAKVVTLLAAQQLDEADRMLPELLAHPAWALTSHDLWSLSLKAYDGRSRWLDTMATIPALVPLHRLLQQLTILSHTETLETMIDYIIGRPQENDTSESPPQSPLYDYFFSPEKLDTDPEQYLRYLEGLRSLRSALREHHTDTTPTLALLISFSELYQTTGGTLTSIRQSAIQPGAINLMSAHKSKGLEFESVYIVGAVDTMWGERVRSRSRLISYPENIPLQAAGDSADERLRLFFVAATRAKTDLTISYSTQNDNAKTLERASFLAPFTATPIETPVEVTPETHAELQWYERFTEPRNDLEQLLEPTLANYKLSATHLGNFLDVSRGGPKAFLIHNLLRFPQAMSPAAAYGSAMHETLQKAHAHLSATGKQRALEDILHDFEIELSRHRLSSAELELYSHKGTEALQAFLATRYDTFKPGQKVELNFAAQHSLVGDVHLTGKLDLIDIDQKEKTMIVTDYKTGSPARSWKGKADYEKMKLHRYRQQLLFYKLLVENSRDYNTFTVERGVLQFVEPTREGQIVALEDDFSESELDTFQALLNAVWGKITTLELPDTSHYDPTYKGILAFERDLLDNSI